MIAALRTAGAPLWLAVALGVAVPTVGVVLVGTMLSPMLLGAGVAVLGVICVVFASWLFKQPVPEQASWEAALVCGVLALSGGLLVVGGLGAVLA